MSMNEKKLKVGIDIESKKGCLEHKYIDFIFLQKEYYEQVLEQLKKKNELYYDALYPKFNYLQLVNEQRNLIFHYYLERDVGHLRFDKPVYGWVSGLSHKNQEEWDLLIKNKKIAKNVKLIEESKKKLRIKHESHAEASLYLKNMTSHNQDIENLKSTVYEKGHVKTKQLGCQ